MSTFAMNYVRHLVMEAGPRFALGMHLAYETGVVAALPAVICKVDDLGVEPSMP